MLYSRIGMVNNHMIITLFYYPDWVRIKYMITWRKAGLLKLVSSSKDQDLFSNMLCLFLKVKTYLYQIAYGFDQNNVVQKNSNISIRFGGWRVFGVGKATSVPKQYFPIFRSIYKELLDLLKFNYRFWIPHNVIYKIDALLFHKSALIFTFISGWLTGIIERWNDALQRDPACLTKLLC